MISGEDNEAMEKGKLLSFKRTFPDYHKFDEKHCYWNRASVRNTCNGFVYIKVPNPPQEFSKTFVVANS